MTNIETLQNFLQNQPQGKIDASCELIELLAECWGVFDGCNFASTTADKLRRMENAAWRSPWLTFVLERHGGTVHGSTRAALHHWHVNVETLTAACDSSGFRQLTARDAAMKTDEIVDWVVESIMNGEEDDNLKWSPDKQRVRIVLTACVPFSPYKQTMAGRTRRLKARLREALPQFGWLPDLKTTGAVFYKAESSERTAE